MGSLGPHFAEHSHPSMRSLQRLTVPRVPLLVIPVTVHGPRRCTWSQRNKPSAGTGEVETALKPGPASRAQTTPGAGDSV